MLSRSFHVVAYDVQDDGRRRRLEKLVKKFVTRVQYSVFEGWLTDSQVESLLRRASAHIEMGHDTLRVYRLCDECAAAVGTIGNLGTPREPDTVIV